MDSRVQVVFVDGPVLPHTSPAVAAPNTGALLTFDGVIRGTENNITIVAIEYDVYLPMALNQMQLLAQRACDKFGLLSLHAAHSKGRVNVGETSFRLTIESAHRQESLESAAWFISEMKKHVAIWKRIIT